MRICITIFFIFLFTIGYGRTIIVAPGSSNSSVKKAIEDAADGDTVLIKPGTYKEGSITISKSISVIAAGNVVLDGEQKFEILTLTGYNILVRGIHFINSGYSALNDFAAIKIVDASNLTIENCKITDAYFAIHISNSIHITIRNNTINGTPKSEQMTGNGIHLWKCSKALIENNKVFGQRDGIYFEFVTFSLIRNNISETNIRYGLHFMFSNDDSYYNNMFRNNGAGVAVMYSKRVWMDGNHFEENWGASAYGLLLKDITDSHIQHNTFKKNTVGIHLEGTSRMDIQRNIFKSNGWALKIQASCEDNNFHVNNFLGNSFDVGTNGTMVLNRFDHNYWDKYEGYDLNKDGLGDVPYHPVSLYSLIVEQNPFMLMLYRSFTTQILDKAEKAIPGLTPESLADNKPVMKSFKL